MQLTDGPTFVISLARRKDRRELFRARAEAIGLENWTFFDAIDGKSMRLYCEHGRGNRVTARPQGPMTPGEVGCYLSHVAVARAAKAIGLSTLAVLEDDVEFLPGFWDGWAELAVHAPTDVALFHLGTKVSHTLPPVVINDHVHRVIDTFGNYFYVASRRVIERIADLDTIERPIDHVLREIQAEGHCYGPRRELIRPITYDSDCGK